MLPAAVMPAATLAAGDLDSLFPAVTRPSRRHVTATMTRAAAVANGSRAGVNGGMQVWYVRSTHCFEVQKEGEKLGTGLTNASYRP